MLTHVFRIVITTLRLVALGSNLGDRAGNLLLGLPV
jgi:hypothetical protein